MHTLLLVLWVVALALILTGAIVAILTLLSARRGHDSRANQASGE